MLDQKANKKKVEIVSAVKLNFEANAFGYDRNLALKLKELFEADLAKCTKLTPEYFERQSRWRKFKQYFSRLLSPIL